MPSDVSVRDSIARRFWAEALLEELRSRYAEEGYEVRRNVNVAGVEADLIAQKGENLEVVEVKAGQWERAKRDAVARLRNWAAQTPNASFKLIWASPPRDPTIDVEGLEEALRSAWEDRVDTSEVAELASVVLFESIADINIDEIFVRAGGIEVAGTGLAEFEMQYGGSRDGFTTPDSYPFSYRVVLSPELKLREIVELEADTASFYE